ncbi:MAG: hypothetical protein IPN61_07935 [Bacteroidetes bacterium]|nr:hypothetical protein [Bacteroidota bacterium]
MDIQAEKLKLIEWLLSLKDHSIIENRTFLKKTFLRKTIGGKLFLISKSNLLTKALKISKKEKIATFRSNEKVWQICLKYFGQKEQFEI